MESDPSPPERILIMRLRGIGDVVLTLPLLDNLRLAFPQAQIDYLTEPPSAPLLQNHPALQEVLVLAHKSWKRLAPLEQARSHWSFVRALRGRRYDWVIDLFGNPRTALLVLLSGARRRIGFNFRGRRHAYNVIVEPRGDRLHAIEFNLDVLRALRVPILTDTLSLPIANDAAAFVGRFWLQHALDSSPMVIGINAFGGWYTKRWPLPAFAELGTRLQRESNAKIVLLWGPGEREEVNQLAGMMKTPPLLAPETTLPQLAALLARMDLLVANDSGPMHLSAAVSTPVVAIFGPTRPDLQGPWGAGHTVVLKSGLPCLGCNGLTCKIQTHDCMQQLPVDQVFQAMQKRLKEILSAKSPMP
ncbi:MAG: glycosyltransferase family 9 protein [bacterium]